MTELASFKLAPSTVSHIYIWGLESDNQFYFYGKTQNLEDLCFPIFLFIRENTQLQSFSKSKKFIMTIPFLCLRSISSEIICVIPWL